MNLPQADSKIIEAMKTYKFPRYTLVNNSMSKSEICKELKESIGWDNISDKSTSEYCQLKLSTVQRAKLPKTYHIHLHHYTEQGYQYGFFVWISDSFWNHENVIWSRKPEFLTKKELLWLSRIFSKKA